MRVKSTQYKGVSKTSRGQRFESYVVVSQSGKRMKLHVGTFDTPELANKARLQYIDNLK